MSVNEIIYDSLDELLIAIPNGVGSYRCPNCKIVLTQTKNKASNRGNLEGGCADKRA